MSAVPIAGGRFLVVGGASLVGQATVAEMRRRGAAEIRVFDNLAFAAPGAVEALQGLGGVQVIEGDVMRPHRLAPAAAGMDGVVHLAALMSLSMGHDPWTGLDVNVRGVQHVIEACRAARVRKLVFASSNAVYGYGPGVSGRLTETTPFHSAAAPPAAILYGASKIIGEQLCRDAYRRHGLDYVALRYSTVYGEGQHARAANALYIVQAHDRIRRGERPQVMGDGTETKHFVYVGDLARANCLALESPATDVAVNCSGPAPITTRALVQLVAELCGRADLAPESVTPPAGEVRLTSGGAFEIDHTAAAEAIGWRPEVDMREGLRRLLAWRERQEGAS